MYTIAHRQSIVLRHSTRRGLKGHTMTHKKMATVALAALLAGMGSIASAQDQSAELDELRARIDALEAEQAATQKAVQNRPTFNLDLAAADTIRALEQSQNIAGRAALGRLAFSVGQSTTVTVYGFARAEAFYDFDFNQGDLSRVSRVGEPDFETDGEFETSVRVSRFGIRSNTATDFGEIKTQLEFDLFGSGGDISTSPNLRLRHANININDTWLIGQFWTNFMPLSHYPRTADFNGPVGITFARTPQIRYTFNTGGLRLSASLEEASGGSSDPVLTGAAFYEGNNWSARIAGLTGTFVDPVTGDDLDTNALTLSGQIKPWTGAAFTATYTTGEGIGNLLIGPGAQSIGGVVSDADGFTLEYRQDINDKFSVGVAYGDESYDLPTSTGAIDFTDVDTLHVNAFYTPVENLTLALEYIFIERTDSFGVDSDANRVGASVTFRF